MASSQQPESDMARFFDDPEFSDVTIVYGDKQIRAHRLILSARSAVLRKALASDSPFQESQTGIYPMSEDEPEAVECMLRYIYKATYELSEPAEPADMNRWEQHLDVAIIADKYDVSALDVIAIDACIESIEESQDDVFNVPRLVQRAAEYHDRHGKLASVIMDKMDDQYMSLFPRADIQEWLEGQSEGRERLMIKHFDELMGTDAFRDMLKKDGEMALRQLDRVRSQAVDKTQLCRKCRNKSYGWGNEIMFDWQSQMETMS